MVTALARNVALIETGWEPGDRLAVHRTSANRLKLSEALLSGELEFHSLVDPSGLPAPFRRNQDRGEIVCAALKILAPDPRSAS